MAQDFFRKRGRDSSRAVVDEFCDFGHDGNLEKSPPPSK
jgi:hypothetical protein